MQLHSSGIAAAVEGCYFDTHDYDALNRSQDARLAGSPEGSGHPRPAADRRQERAAVDAFMAATSRGDFDGLLRVLDPDVTWPVHTTRRVVVRRGSTEVAAAVQRAERARGTARRVRVNGAFGVAAWTPDGRLRTVMACTVAEGRIVEMESVTDPAQLASIDLPR